jgi:hypothetical protein
VPISGGGQAAANPLIVRPLSHFSPLPPAAIPPGAAEAAAVIAYFGGNLWWQPQKSTGN